MARLYDASAFFNLLTHGIPQTRDFEGQAVLDLTQYELGHIIRKRYAEIGKEDAMRLLDKCINLTARMRVLCIHGVERDVVAMSIMAKLSFYDSAYVVVARQHGLELVTDDHKMLAAARGNGIAAVVSGAGFNAPDRPSR